MVPKHVLRLVFLEHDQPQQIDKRDLLFVLCELRKTYKLINRLAAHRFIVKPIKPYQQLVYWNVLLAFFSQFPDKLFHFIYLSWLREPDWKLILWLELLKAHLRMLAGLAKRFLIQIIQVRSKKLFLSACKGRGHFRVQVELKRRDRPNVVRLSTVADFISLHSAKHNLLVLVCSSCRFVCRFELHAGSAV
jgi:hypothetical protein